MQQKKQKRLFNFLFLFCLALFFVPEKLEVKNASTGQKRVRYKFFGKTFVIVDTNSLNNDIIIHIFDYSTELAHQFINGVYNGSLDLWSVQ